MDLSLTDEQQSLRDAFADLFAKEATPARVRAAEDTAGYDADLWRIVADSGVPLMAVAEARGGGGATLEDTAIVAREAGRRLAPVPVAEAVAANRLLAAVPPDRLAGVAHDLLDGSVPVTVALRPARDGVASLVPAGAVAGAVVVLAGDELVLVRAHGPARRTLGNAPLADVAVGSTERTVLATGAEARARHAVAATEWRLLTAAGLDGLRAEALRLGVDYVRERHAFGVPIGWFQTVSHRLADVATAGDGTELLVNKAAWALDGGHRTGPGLAAMAFLQASDVAFRTAAASLQFHGGYGYTLEYDIQLYLRRAKAWPLAAGPRRLELRRLAQLTFVEGQA